MKEGTMLVAFHLGQMLPADSRRAVLMRGWLHMASGYSC
jgi:hypothetical protein